MNAAQLLTKKLLTLKEIIETFREQDIQEFVKMSDHFSTALSKGGTIFWCGNGGSAAESTHLAVELIGRFKNNRVSLPSISLTSDSVAITCISNDFGFEYIFSRQLEALAKDGDVLVVLSTSGESANILKVLESAQRKNVYTIGLLGKGGGKAKKLCNSSIIVNSNETARIQEIHLLIGHTLCEYSEFALGFEKE